MSCATECSQPQEKRFKAVVSNKIYLHAPEGSELAKALAAELTYEIQTRPLEPVKVYRHALRVNANIMAIPFGRTDLIPGDYLIVDKCTEVPVHIPTPRFELRDKQAEFVAECQGTGILAAKPG